MDTAKTMSPTLQQVVELLLVSPATVEEISRHINKTERSVYRALDQAEDFGFEVVRTGKQKNYTFSVRRVEA
jgi:predicted transcriptional regulator